MALSDDVTFLENKLEGQSGQHTESSRYYEATYRLKTVGMSAPPAMRKLNSAVGWPRLYIDAIEERLDVEGFRLAGAADHLDQLRTWWQANNLDEESGLAHLDAMIYGATYVTVAAPGPGDPPSTPLIRVESPKHMVAEIDPRTRKVTRALRLYTDDLDRPKEALQDLSGRQYATLYLPNQTLYYVKDRTTKGQWVLEGDQPEPHNLGVVPVVPMINRERLSNRMGQSEITTELRSFTDSASRLMMNMSAAAELMAIPQRVLFGIDPDKVAPNGTPDEVDAAYMARILAFEDEGSLAQFQAAELRNYTDALQELTKHVAAYTGLPPQYLSFASDNPASAEAIRSAESRLVKKCERKARLFGGVWEDVMRLAMRVMGQEIPEEYVRLETVWRDPATPTYAAKADAVMKLTGGQPVLNREYGRIELGYSEEIRDDMRNYDQSEGSSIDALLSRVPMPERPESEAA